MGHGSSPPALTVSPAGLCPPCRVPEHYSGVTLQDPLPGQVPGKLQVEDDTGAQKPLLVTGSSLSGPVGSRAAGCSSSLLPCASREG